MTPELNPQDPRSGYCIFVDTLCDGPVPIFGDGDGNSIVFESEVAAQRVSAEYQIDRLQAFLAGERDFEEAMAVDEFVVAVTLGADGVIVDEAGRRYGRGMVEELPSAEC